MKDKMRDAEFSAEAVVLYDWKRRCGINSMGVDNGSQMSGGHGYLLGPMLSTDIERYLPLDRTQEVVQRWLLECLLSDTPGTAHITGTEAGQR